MGQNHSYEAVSHNEAVPSTYEKLVLPEDLTVDLQPFKITRLCHSKNRDITGYKFVFETKYQNFDRYTIFISEEKYINGKTAIYINKERGYRGSAGVDYHQVDDVARCLVFNDHVYSDINYYFDAIRKLIFNIDQITYKFIDLTKDYQPVLYKLLVFLKTSK